MDEMWAIVYEFPTYKISTYGQVVNIETGRVLKESTTSRGVVKVGLVSCGVQYTRSVKVLVAEAFVEGQTELYDTPIHLDGEYQNLRADNLLWRPRWFALRYARQFNEPTVHHTRGPIMDVKTKIVYATFLEASIENGILIYDIWLSVAHKRPTFPTNQNFTFVR